MTKAEFFSKIAVYETLKLVALLLGFNGKLISEALLTAEEDNLSSKKTIYIYKQATQKDATRERDSVMS